MPVGVDVSRIFLRSGFLRVNRERLLKSGLKENPAEEEILFVVNASGLDTVDEITQARACSLPAGLFACCHAHRGVGLRRRISGECSMGNKIRCWPMLLASGR